MKGSPLKFKMILLRFQICEAKGGNADKMVFLMECIQRR